MNRLLLALTLLFVACASREKHRDVDVAAATLAFTADDEMLMAREALPQIHRDYPALQDEKVQNYISALGKKIVAANGFANHPYDYTFVVVDVPNINAFALPAGKIFVSAPLIRMTETEAELAGVLGHEIAHVEARHAARRVIAAREAKSQSWKYGAGGAIAGGVVAAGASALICKGSGGCLAGLIALGAVAGVQGGLLVQKYAFLENSQANELEADRNGFADAVKAGYAPDHVGDFYSRLAKMKTDRSIADVAETHPLASERVEQIKRLAEKKSGSSLRILSTPEFDEVRESLAP